MADEGHDGIHKYSLLCRAFFAGLYRVSPDFDDGSAPPVPAEGPFAALVAVTPVSTIHSVVNALHTCMLTHRGADSVPLSSLGLSADCTACITSLGPPILASSTHLCMSDVVASSMSSVYDASRRNAHIELQRTKRRLLRLLLTPHDETHATPLSRAMRGQCHEWRGARSCPAAAAARVTALVSSSTSPGSSSLLALCAVALDSMLAVMGGMLRPADAAGPPLREALAGGGVSATAVQVRLEDDALLVESMQLPSPTFIVSLLAFMRAFCGMTLTLDGALCAINLNLHALPHPLVLTAALAALPLPLHARTLWRAAPRGGEYLSCLAAAAATGLGTTSTWAGMLRPRSHERNLLRVRVPIPADMAYSDAGEVLWAASAVDIESGGSGGVLASSPRFVRTCAALAMGMYTPAQAPAPRNGHASINTSEGEGVPTCATHGETCSYLQECVHGRYSVDEGRRKRARTVVWRCALL